MSSSVPPVTAVAQTESESGVAGGALSKCCGVELFYQEECLGDRFTPIFDEGYFCTKCSDFQFNSADIYDWEIYE